MLANGMEKAGENDADEVMVLHISPSGNHKVHRVTSQSFRRFGNDAFEVFGSLLVEPSRFKSVFTEQAFKPAIEQALSEDSNDPWASYLQSRYTFLRG